MNPITKMKVIKQKIDDLESKLILETFPEDERKQMVNELDELWTKYEAMLHNTWEEIDPSSPRLPSDDERLAEYHEQQARNRRYDEVDTDE
jgi:vacuolar-type H+-ATPase subunit I/STV1